MSRNNVKYTNEEIVAKFKEVHGDRYDYSLVDYVNNKTKVKIICSIHGVFEAFPSNHLRGCNCKKCTGQGLSTTEMVDKFKEVHGDRYDYSLVEYINDKTKVKIMCKEHGIFEILPYCHTNNVGCKMCGSIKSANAKRKNQEDIINGFKKVHNDLYDYSQVNYTDSKTKVVVICREHGEFLITPNNHLRKKGCPKCKFSKNENKIRNFLIDENINFIEQKRFSNCKYKYTLPFDFYLPDYDTIIEYDGEQHFIEHSFSSDKSKETKMKNLGFIQLKDKIKTDYCINNNIKLIRIPYWDKDKIEEILTKELM